MKLHVLFALVAAIGISRHVSAGRVTFPFTLKHVTVKHGAPVALKCEFHRPNPAQVLWVRGRLGLMSLDGEEFFSIAKTLDPKLDREYRLECTKSWESPTASSYSDDDDDDDDDDTYSASTLIIDSADVDNWDHANPYRCVVDIFHELRFELAIVKDDLKCWRAGSVEPFVWMLASDLPWENVAVGDKFEIECSVTKDTSGFGKIDFVLLVGGQPIVFHTVDGASMQRNITNVAKTTFSVTVDRSFEGKNVSVAIATTGGYDPMVPIVTVDSDLHPKTATKLPELLQQFILFKAPDHIQNMEVPLEVEMHRDDGSGEVEPEYDVD